MMREGYNKVFWGIIILTFSINIGSIRILPVFVGWLLIGNGIKILMEYQDTEALTKAYNMSNILTAITIIWGILDFFQVTGFPVFFQYLPILTTILQLILFLKVFEGTIVFLKSKEELIKASHIETNLDTYMKATISAIIIYIIGITFYIEWILFISTIGMVLINIYLLTIFSRLSKLDIFDSDQINDPTDEI